MREFNDILGHTNAILAEEKKSPVSKGELLKFLGLRLAMAADSKRGGVPTYFQQTQEEGTIYTPPDYGNRFHMSRHRFQDISSSLRLAPPADPSHGPVVRIYIYIYMRTTGPCDGSAGGARRKLEEMS